MTEITSAMESIVESSELPRRLRDEVYDTVRDREDVTKADIGEIVQAVESQYLDTRVDPLDPVGTVSAQSIGEPGTQMSLPSDERILVRQSGDTSVREIGSFVDDLMHGRDILSDRSIDNSKAPRPGGSIINVSVRQYTRTIDDHEVALAPEGIEVLSLRNDERVAWKPVEEISRHETPEELLEITLESGRSIRATKAHSFVKKVDDEIVPVAGDTLTTEDELPTVGEYDRGDSRAKFTAFESDRTALADGGALLAKTENGETSAGDVVWERIESIETVTSEHEHVYDVSVEGLETFTTAEGVVTHNTMNTFHYAGVAEFDVTQGLPRLIELVDARKEPDTPIMTVYLEDEYAQDREKAHEVVWQIEATRILELGDVSTNVADMLVQVDLNADTLLERWPNYDDPTDVAASIAETIEAKLGVSTVQDGTVVEFGPEEPSYRQLLQLVEKLREIVFKGIDDISRVVVRKEEGESDELVLYTEGSAFKKCLDIEGVDATRTTCNNIHEIHETLGIEAAREAIINETMNTLEEQGLDDVNIRHLMLVADAMTNDGTIESIGRHGISGSKESVLARAAFEVTVNHLLDAAVHGEIDDLNGVTENVIVGKPIKLGTGDVDLRMRSKNDSGSQAD